MRKIDSGIVFSYDINRILNGKNAINFDYKGQGLIIPGEKEIVRLRKDFEKDVNRIFSNNVSIISEQEMEEYLISVLDKEKDVPVVSLDMIYLRDEICTGNELFFLDCTRVSGTKELIPRKEKDAVPIYEQIRRISNQLKKIKKTDILLFDDVVFSGDVLRKIIELFNQNGISVKGIRACISTERSYNDFNRFLDEGLDCGCLLGEDVIDQVCERDFYFGIVQSGISMRAQDGKTYKAPYFKPYGDPVDRASIPKEYEVLFSNGCIMRSMYLWNTIEKLSGRKIYMRELPEKIINTSDNERIIDCLRRGINYDGQDNDEKNPNRNHGVSSRPELWK